MKPITIDYENRKIIISSAFKKKASNPTTYEYEQLQSVRRDYADFHLEIKVFKKNVCQDRHKNLTYDYMRWFIGKYEEPSKISDKLAEFDKMLDIAKAHSTGKRYPAIKSWFLKSYPDYAEFGMTEEAIAEYRHSSGIAALRENCEATALRKTA